MQTTSYKIADKLYLIQHELDQKSAAPAKPVELPTNHIAVIDCSGSMSWDLPKIREQLKKKLPKLLKEQDTISIIWFSGRREFGTLLEAEPVATLTDLQSVNQAIDRWLRPVCLTGFKEPIEEAGKLIGRIAKKAAKNSIYSLFFMSDGCDNQWGRQEILKAVEGVSDKLSAATFVEYGYYADRPLLTQMAEKAGGTLIFSEDFDSYAPLFEGAIQKKLSGAPRIEVDIKGDAINGFVYTATNDELVTYGIEGGTVKVPEDTRSLWYLAPTVVGKEGRTLDKIAADAASTTKDSKDVAAVGVAYAALSLYSQRMKADVVLALLKATGDVQFINQFATCFGKQRYSEFMDATKAAAFNPDKWFADGRDPKLIPPDDAFTVLDLLRVLADDDDNYVLLDSKDFKYSKIGRGRIDSSEVLSADEQKEVAELTAQMAGIKDAKKVKELSDKIAAIMSKKGPALKFEAEKQPNGYSISSLTLNETRPNVSFLVRKTGKVDISSRIPAGDKTLAKLPKVFDSFIFRNYTVVKDGLINMERLPVRLTGGTVRALRAQGLPMIAISDPEGETAGSTVARVKKAANDRPVNVVFDLRQLPIINRKMVKEVSAQTLFEKEYELCQARAAQKVYNSYKKARFPRESKGFVDQYGKEAADWLKEQGITDYSGFNPKSVQAEAKDFYMGKELKVSLKGLSSLPSLKEASDKITKGKITPSVALMAPAIEEVEKFLNPGNGKNVEDKEFETWLNAKAIEAKNKVRGLLFELAQIKFSIVVGQTWPCEFNSLDENSLDIVTRDGTPISGKLEMREIEIRI